MENPTSHRRMKTLDVGGHLGRSPHVYVVSAEGFEPSTNGLKGHCSAIELRARGILQQESGLHFIMWNFERQRNMPTVRGV